MATEAKILQIQSPVLGSFLTSLVKGHCTEEQRPLQITANGPIANSHYDFFLSHTGSDASWTMTLAERLCGRFGNQNLRLSLTDWTFARGADASVEMRNNLQGNRLVGIVISRAMLREDYQAVQRTMEFLKGSSPAEARIVTILKDNATIPPLLRLSEWFDFRNEELFQESLSDLSYFLREYFALGGKTSRRSANLRLDSEKGSASLECSYSFGVSSARERIISNLFPVVEVPKFVYSAGTRFATETELTKACGAAGPSPFLLKGSRLYTIEPLSQHSVFAPALSNGAVIRQENLTQWFSRRDRAGWAIELLNNLFRHHAWKRGLRCDKSTDQYYFPRTKPKSVWWEISKQTISREVTAPHMGWIELDNRVRAEIQYGWRHQTIRAEIVQLMGNLYLRLEPSWLLTELDGKTPATTQPVGPIFSGSPQLQRNGQALRSLRFWSAVLAKGHHEIRINTGQAPVRIKLSPLSGFTQFGIPSDEVDYDQLMLTELEDDLLMPALGPLEQESVISDEEIIPSETLGRSGSGQPQACAKHSSA